MRFFAHSGGFDFGSMREFWLEADRLGFDGASCPDHPSWGLETWTVLTAIAATTRRLRVCPLVLAVTHRNPAWLAYQVVTLDIITGGRAMVGLGAGWNADEHRAFGLDLPLIGERIRRLEEAIALCKTMWENEEEGTTFVGRYYAVEGLRRPRPVQLPCPPILVGGRGPRLMRVVARHANLWNPGWDDMDFPLDESARRLEEVCAEVGRPVDEIELAPAYTLYIGETEAGVREAWRHDAKRQDVSEEQLRAELPGAIAGTPEQVAQRLRLCQQAGATTVFLLFRGPDRVDRLRLFAREVLPAFA